MNTCIRYLYTVLNLLFIVAGLVLIAFAVYVLAASPIHELLVNISGNMILIYGMIIMGSVIFLVGACGALGACYENRCLLIIYLSCNVVFLLAQVGIVIFAIIEKDNMKSHLSDVWIELNNDTKYLIQDRFSCCGYHNETEWGENIPESCINTTIVDKMNTVWSASCYSSFVEYLEENLIYAGAIGGLVVLLQCFQIVVTVFLLRDFGRKVEDDADPWARERSHNADAVRHYDADSVDTSFDTYSRRPYKRGYQETNLSYNNNNHPHQTDELY